MSPRTCSVTLPTLSTPHLRIRPRRSQATLQAGCAELTISPAAVS
jgi:hypothetical protein